MASGQSNNNASLGSQRRFVKLCLSVVPIRAQELSCKTQFACQKPLICQGFNLQGLYSPGEMLAYFSRDLRMQHKPEVLAGSVRA